MNTVKSVKWQRLETVFAGGRADRTPTLGGWLACVEHICALSGTPLDRYWDDPLRAGVKAYEALDNDGLVGIFVPPGKEDWRIVDAHNYKRADTGETVEAVVARIDAMPSAKEIISSFDMEGEYAAFKADLISRAALCGDMAYMPANWNNGARATWYDDFGYENFFVIVGAYPERAVKLFEIGGARGHNNGRLIARAVEEGLYPHATFFGEDICTQRGPMIAPDFLEEHYIPQLRVGIQPLLDAGCKPVWHSDGDVRPLVNMLIGAGIQGFQGFQPECGMTLEYITQFRTREGRPLLIFGPLSVTTELPVLSADAIRARVREAIAICEGKADLVLFTANTINPDTPLDNVIAMYEAVKG